MGAQSENSAAAHEARFLYAGKVANIPQWNFPSHKHDDLHEVLIIMDGQGIFTIGAQQYHVRAGNILVYNRGVLHEESSLPEAPIAFYYCGFSYPALLHAAEDWVVPPWQEPLLRDERTFAAVVPLVQLLFEETTTRRAGYQALERHLLAALLLLIKRTVQERAKMTDVSSPSLALQIKEYIDTNFTAKLTLKDLGERFHLNPYYLAHIFKKYYHTSPINYIIHRRIGEASRLLVSTEMKVWEIAKLLGYDDANYFSIIFKRVTRLSPQAFREENRKYQHLMPR